MRYTLTFNVEDAEVVLGWGEVLRSGLFVPGARLTVVLRYAFAFGVKGAEIVLGWGMTLGGGFFVPRARA